MRKQPCLHGQRPAQGLAHRGHGAPRHPEYPLDAVREVFDDRHRRVTAELAARRNELVAALSTALLVLHAAPGGRVERLATAALAAGTPVFVAVPERATTLARVGARPATEAAIRAALAPAP